jgi:hypothetical protein
MGSFASIAGAEIALTREFGRHVFEIAALLRVLFVLGTHSLNGHVPGVKHERLY